jgi:transposase
MLHTGLDIHKRYSVAVTLNERGERLRQARLNHDHPGAFADYFSSLPEPSEVLLEACWNWGTVYDQLEALEAVSEVMVSHPAKNRIIAEAQIKTDKIDAHALGTLLRGRFFARVHVPSKDVRAQKNVLRRRLWMARMRTRVRNRIHALLDRHPDLERPQFKDVFCKKGVSWMRRVKMPEPDRSLLDEELSLLSLLGEQIRHLEERIEAYNSEDVLAVRLRTLPGVGPILAAVMALEIDTIDRFRSAPKLCAYAGLVPSTYSSGGKTSHGRMLRFCNRWLKWAFIEAAWVAVGCSDYFGQLYRTHRARGKGANEAISITARRMATIAWQMLKQERDYSAQPRVCPPQKISPAALDMD